MRRTALFSILNGLTDCFLLSEMLNGVGMTVLEWWALYGSSPSVLCCSSYRSAGSKVTMWTGNSIPTYYNDIELAGETWQ